MENITLVLYDTLEQRCDRVLKADSFPVKAAPSKLAALWRLTYERYVTCYVDLRQHDGTFFSFLFYIFFFFLPKDIFLQKLLLLLFFQHKSRSTLCPRWCFLAILKAELFWLASDAMVTDPVQLFEVHICELSQPFPSRLNVVILLFYYQCSLICIPN